MSAIEVTTQQQLNAAIKALKAGDWIVCLGGTYWKPLRADGNATVEAYGNATVRADGNATVEAYGNATVRADGNATVRAYGNATVEADGNATVRADGNATVRADGNATVEADGTATVRADGNATVRADGNATVEADGTATVEAYGNATVRAYGNATVEAGRVVPVQKYPSHRGTISGGIVIDVPDLSKLTPKEWLAWYGIKESRGSAVLFKALDADLATSHSRSAGLIYTPGATIEAPDWLTDPVCGFGLHACAKAWIAKRYNASASRYVQVRVKVADIVVIAGGDGDKVKVPRMTVVCECDIDGEPLPVIEPEVAA